MTVIGRTSRRECPEHGWPEWANMADNARCPRCEAPLEAVEYVTVRADDYRGAVSAGWALSDAIVTALRLSNDEPDPQALWQAVEAWQAAAPERGSRT